MTSASSIDGPSQRDGFSNYTVGHGAHGTAGRYRTGIDEAFCYITTRGRRTGRPHTIEIWFAAGSPTTIYALAGGRERADWVRNVLADPAVAVRIGEREGGATGRVVEEGTDEDARARRLLVAKYQSPGATDLEGWGRSALPVAFDLGF
ncbi:MAG: nitroreductase family deazaflavin-dependent oxidoreductase [Actinomycetota bacterium]|nr:nitroreductase family deazaflavin-dependent oxidoreductase [Actinomycetota bacterium]